MKRLLLAIASLLLVAGCYGPSHVTPTPVVEPEPEIPPHFTTYTSEGLFSISYPPELVPDTEIMEELFENTKEIMKTTDPEVTLEDDRYVFLGHIPRMNILRRSVSMGGSTSWDFVYIRGLRQLLMEERQ